jgi:cell division protein ZapB
MSENRFQALNEKVDELVSVYSQLKQENQLLKANERNWQNERRDLIEKNKAAKSQLESILTRLKAMEES